MEFQIIALKNLVISNGSEVRIYGPDGQRIYHRVPTLKMFGEVAYLRRPTGLIGDTFETALAQYMDNLNPGSTARPARDGR